MQFNDSLVRTRWVNNSNVFLQPLSEGCSVGWAGALPLPVAEDLYNSTVRPTLTDDNIRRAGVATAAPYSWVQHWLSPSLLVPHDVVAHPRQDQGLAPVSASK